MNKTQKIFFKIDRLQSLPRNELAPITTINVYYYIQKKEELKLLDERIQECIDLITIQKIRIDQLSKLSETIYQEIYRSLKADFNSLRQLRRIKTR